jgi:hypothetical protein
MRGPPALYAVGIDEVQRWSTPANVETSRIVWRQRQELIAGSLKMVKVEKHRVVASLPEIGGSIHQLVH